MNRETVMLAGIDYDEGVRRFAGNTGIYEKYLAKMFDTDSMELLQKQLQEKEYDAAFKTAHDLKGVSGNLSMSAFFSVICTIVDALRHGSPHGDIIPLYDRAQVLYEQARTAILTE